MNLDEWTNFLNFQLMRCFSFIVSFLFTLYLPFSFICSHFFPFSSSRLFWYFSLVSINCKSCSASLVCAPSDKRSPMLDQNYHHGIDTEWINLLLAPHFLDKSRPTCTLMLTTNICYSYLFFDLHYKRQQVICKGLTLFTVRKTFSPAY